MQIRRGWSGETSSAQWTKLDVYLDEVDLRRLIAEHGPPGLGDMPLESFSATGVFRVLNAEAERLLAGKLAGPSPSPDAVEAFRKLGAQVAELVRGLADGSSP